MKTILVAGASGYLGRHAVHEFKKRGYRVRALVRDPDKVAKGGAHLEPAIAGIADELFVGEVTRPETLAGLCDGIDYVFSALGMTRPDFVHSSFDVDYRGNLAILRLAQKAGVKKFVYVSVFQADRMMGIQNIEAHEKFIEELKASGMAYAVIRPTGYYSDMGMYIGMARNGFMLSLGEGTHRINPIHGADLAAVAADGLEGSEREIDAGGPETFTYSEIMQLAAEVAGRSPLTLPIPLWLADGVAAVTQFVNRDVHDIALFASAVSKMDSVAPAYGTHKLRDYFEELVRAGH